MAKETVYNNTLVSGAADETLTYTRYVKDESSGKSTKEILDEKVNKTDQLGTTQIADKAVTTEKLENESVTTDKLDAASVTTDKVADANITTSKLADSSVETEKINNKAVTTDKLNDGAVVNSKLSPNAVTSEKIKDESIITEKLNDRAVTTEKVEEKAITNPKLGDQSVDGRVVREASLETKHFANESVTTEKVARKSITKDKLADNAVDASQVVDGSIGNAKLSPDSVTTEKIKDGSVTNEKIADNTLVIGKFDPELRKTIQAATGLPDDLNQMIQDVDQSVKQLHEKDADLQSQIDDKQQQITANDEDISLLQTRSTQMEEAIKGISASGGASQASAVTYENTKSGLDSITAQGAIDELANKKFNKENIAQELGDSKDKAVSQFALPFRVIESPEFIMAVVDSDNRALFGIYRDTGKPYYPQNDMYHIAQNEEFLWVILDAANHPLIGIQQDGTCWAAKAQWLNDIKAIKETLSSIDETLKTFQPKEDGKGLINIEIADSFFYISNNEYIIAVVDAEYRILAGIKYDGEPYFPNHEMYSVITNEEWLYAIIDEEGKVLGGFRADDGHMVVGGIDIHTFIANAIIDIADIKERTAHLSTIENNEYLSVETDADGKVIGYTAPDGSHYLYKVKSETIPTEFEHIEDPEGRTEITTDAEGKVMSFRDLQGKKHEHGMEIKNLDVSNLNLQGNSVNNIQDALKANGFSTKSLMDWSDNSEIHIPEPNCAFANIIGEFPTTKGNTTKGIIQFYDMQGNYFQKYIEMDIHGRTSAAFKKKNYTFDFYNDEEMTDSFIVKFGNWVAFDSYYFQGWYTDSFRGIDIIAYKLYQKIIGTRGCMKDKPYKYTILSNISSEGSDNNETNIDINLGKNALCTPMGFPVIMYHNDEFWGIYTVMLKKNRNNFLMDKKDYTSIMLDLDQINVVVGDLKWDSFEIRNPKTLICMDGSKYNGDSPKELIDETSDVYDASNKDMKNTIKTKTALKNLCQAYNDIQKAIEAKKGNEEIRNLIEQHYNVDYIIDYILFSNIIENADGWGGNWQWSTWDGVKWNPNPYDLNATFGLDPYGLLGNSPSTTIRNASITSIVYQYYLNEITARYSELRKEGVVSLEYISNLFDEWIKRIGTENYSKEFKKWNTTPSQRDSNLNKEYWKRVSKVLGSRIFSSYSEEVSFKKNEVVWYQWKLYKSLIDGNQGNSLSDSEKWELVSYDKTKEYNIGDRVYCASDIVLQFECIKNCVGQSPITKYYKETYGIFGFHDSIGRIYKWLQEKIKILDEIFKYN